MNVVSVRWKSGRAIVGDVPRHTGSHLGRRGSGRDGRTSDSSSVERGLIALEIAGLSITGVLMCPFIRNRTASAEAFGARSVRACSKRVRVVMRWGDRWRARCRDRRRGTSVVDPSRTKERPISRRPELGIGNRAARLASSSEKSARPSEIADFVHQAGVKPGSQGKLAAIARRQMQPTFQHVPSQRSRFRGATAATRAEEKGGAAESPQSFQLSLPRRTCARFAFARLGPATVAVAASRQT